MPLWSFCALISSPAAVNFSFSFATRVSISLTTSSSVIVVVVPSTSTVMVLGAPGALPRPAGSLKLNCVGGVPPMRYVVEVVEDPVPMIASRPAPSKVIFPVLDTSFMAPSDSRAVISSAVNPSARSSSFILLARSWTVPEKSPGIVMVFCAPARAPSTVTFSSLFLRASGFQTACFLPNNSILDSVSLPTPMISFMASSGRPISARVIFFPSSDVSLSLPFSIVAVMPAMAFSLSLSPSRLFTFSVNEKVIAGSDPSCTDIERSPMAEKSRSFVPLAR